MMLSNFGIFYKIEQEQIINQLFPNIWVFIAHVIATIVLLIILRVWVYKPFKAITQKRADNIKKLIEDSLNKQAEATKHETEASILLKNAKVEFQQIVEDAKLVALNQRQEIIAEAMMEAKLINEQTQKDMLKERIKEEENIREEIITIAFNVAQNILTKKIDHKENEFLIDEFIDELN